MAERQALKRPRSDQTNGSSKKRKTPSPEEQENINPLRSAGSFDSPKPGPSSVLRSAEWSVKPDTPAILSVKSRIQKLSDSVFETPVTRNIRSDGESAHGEYAGVCNLSNSSDSSGTVAENKDGLQETDQVVVKSVVDMFEKRMTPEPLPPPPSEPVKIKTESTSAVCMKLFSQPQSTASLSGAIRLRKEREAEIALLCATLDPKNPWRKAITKQRSLRRDSPREMQVPPSAESLQDSAQRGQGAEKNASFLQSTDDSTVSDMDPFTPDNLEEDLFGNTSEERCVSSLEIRLKGYSPEIDLDTKKHTSSPRKVTFASQTETIPSTSYDEGDSMSSLSRKASENESDQPDDHSEIERNEVVNNSAMIDQIFRGVLDSEDSEKSEPEGSSQDGHQDCLPPFSILSPLGKSVNLESVVTPLNSVVSSLPELSEASDNNTPPTSTPVSSSTDFGPPYSIDAYRSLRRNLAQVGVEGTPPEKKPSPIGLNGGTPESALDSENLNLKEKIKLLNEEVTALQRIVQQTSQALNCCVDEEHGKGSREEAEAERLLLVSSEKRVALLNMLTRLKSAESPGSASPQSIQGLEPCRGSVTISDIRLPLKMDYLCSVMNRAGKPSHYFLLLIRFGSHYIVATPLASVQDALCGDAIVFPTSVTLNDTASTFEIDIEVYSLTQNGVTTTIDKRKSSRSKITPKKLLSSRKTSFASPAFSSPTGSSIRTSNFLLVGSRTVSLESLNKTKFPLDKMKFEGKVGRLLGAHFQDKVPFLSPLEGNVHLKLQCQSHSNVHHSGFLTMFEDVSGFGAWHRRWCVLSGNYLSFWTYPDQEKTMDPLGQINLFNCTSPQIEAASWEFCARPNTLELITVRPQQEDDKETLVTQCRNTLCFTKTWLSADTKEERCKWMEHLNQALVNLRTWRTTSDKITLSPQSSQTETGMSLTLQCGPNDSGISVATNWEQADATASVRETEC
ncbi:anillin-like isoform X1 [Pleurodeles waltl]|uniref:anillin-like isoform X1 n=1 Tax=Pleurodeles waltl TaxID=8319 RepID=UPI003709BA55